MEFKYVGKSNIEILNSALIGIQNKGYVYIRDLGDYGI